MAQKNDQPPASPTLIPALPSPIPPTTSSAATSEELSFFDRAKKSISNKNTFNEFLKLCNLFSQDLVDRTVLVHRARSFIGTNPELMKWFQDFIGYDEKDVIVENKARIPGGRVSLSNCRGLGPSYRLLPKRVRRLSSPVFQFPLLSCGFPIVLDDVRMRGGWDLNSTLAWRRLVFGKQRPTTTRPHHSRHHLLGQILALAHRTFTSIRYCSWTARFRSTHPFTAGSGHQYHI